MNSLQGKIGYKFKNDGLLQTALTHQSFANETGATSYERLEFLGDAVIELIVSEFIYSNFSLDSGKLTKLRAYMVSTDYFNQISLELGLDNLMLKGKSLTSVSKKNSADLFESLVGAIYLDGGFDEAKKIVTNYVIIDQTNVEKCLTLCEDSKTKLQEIMQSEGKTFEYRLVSTSGLDNEKTFEVELFIDGKSITMSMGCSIKEAQEKCAQLYLESKK